MVCLWESGSSDGVLHGAGEMRCLVIGLIPVLFLCTKMFKGQRVTTTIPVQKFLCGYLKAKFCISPANLDMIRRIITRDKVKIKRAVRDLLKRSRLCIDRGRGHVHHSTGRLLF